MLANPPIPTTEQVMEELNHATNLYFNCPDPVESAVRRQSPSKRGSRRTTWSWSGYNSNSSCKLWKQLSSCGEGNKDPVASTSASHESRRGNRWEPSNCINSYIATSTNLWKERRPAKLRSTNVSPKILTGTSSKKRNLALVHNSPGRTGRSPGIGPSKRSQVPQLQMMMQDHLQKMTVQQSS